MRIEAAKLPVAKKPYNNRLMYATVCYYYGYSLKEASQLAARDIALLVNTAKKIEARRMYELTQIVAAPHTKNGSGVKTLSAHFSKEMK